MSANGMAGPRRRDDSNMCAIHKLVRSSDPNGCQFGQSTFLKHRGTVAALLMSAQGTSRHFAATQQFSRFRSEADIGSAALAEPDL
jgi:hypothetical protein